MPRLRSRLSRTVYLGRKFSASSSRITVTTSTEICVSARSGADRYRNEQDTISPMIPTSTSAMIRSRWKVTMQPVATIRSSQPMKGTALIGSIGRVVP